MERDFRAEEAKVRKRSQSLRRKFHDINAELEAIRNSLPHLQSNVQTAQEKLDSVGKASAGDAFAKLMRRKQDQDKSNAAGRQLQVAMGELNAADEKQTKLVEKLTSISQELMQIDHEVPEPLRSVPPLYIEDVD